MSWTKSKSTDAIDLLTADHDRIKKLFKNFSKLKEVPPDEKSALVTQICTELTIHDEIEDEIFYPAARDVIGQKNLIDEALVEHASARTLIEALQDMEPGEEKYDAKVTVLGEYINHHITEEEAQIFPEVKKAGMNTAALGERLSELKSERMEDVGVTSNARSGRAFSHSPSSTPTPGASQRGRSGHS